LNRDLRKRKGAFLGIYLVTRSIIVPRGHIQPQKNLPRIKEKPAMRAPGNRRREKAFWERR
jgi:hypothetical protein